MNQQRRSLKRRSIRASPNPIEQGDLDNLRKNPPDKVLAVDLPDGLGFDRFGLMVHEQYVVVPALSASSETDGCVVPVLSGSATTGSSESKTTVVDPSSLRPERK